jgi:hypothetical protein
MEYQHRYTYPQPPSFTLTPDMGSPRSDGHEPLMLPPISADVSTDGDSDLEPPNYEDEVDQLLSDADDDLRAPQVQLHKMPEFEQEDIEPTESEVNVSAIKKSRTGRLERIPGHTVLPQTRVEGIIQADGLSSSCVFMTIA